MTLCTKCKNEFAAIQFSAVCLMCVRASERRAGLCVTYVCACVRERADIPMTLSHMRPKSVTATMPLHAYTLHDYTIYGEPSGVSACAQINLFVSIGGFALRFIAWCVVVFGFGELCEKSAAACSLL